MARTRPNIVIIFADDLGYGDVSTLNPYSRIPTPHMDRVAQEGCTFTDAHSSSAVCTPSRYSLLTGRYCWRTWLDRGVLFGWSPPLIEAERPTLGTVLMDAGYHTNFVGKWHLGLGYPGMDPAAPRGDAVPERINWSGRFWSGPHTLGFERSCIIPASLDMAPYLYIADGLAIEGPTSSCADSPRPAYWRGGPRAPGFEHGTCLLECTVRAEATIDLHAASGSGEPFLLVFSTPSPHTPHVPRAPFQGATPAGPYGDQVVEHDWSVGRILAALDRNGLAEDTLVIVSSDNGAHSGPLGLEASCGHRSNERFRGQKSDAWDGGHRIPLLVRWPRGIRPGTTSGALVCLSDVFATAAALAGVTLPAQSAQDSVDLSPLFANPTATVRRSLIHHSIDGRFAVRRDAWKLVCCRGSGGWSLKEDAVPTDAPPAQLYDVASDPEETRNRWTEEPDTVAELEGILAAAGAPGFVRSG